MTELVADQPEETDWNFAQVVAVSAGEVRIENYACEDYASHGPKRSPKLLLPVDSIKVLLEVFPQQIVLLGVAEPLTQRLIAQEIIDWVVELITSSGNFTIDIGANAPL